MAQWYVKDLSKLTGVSVQTLHHYDRIGLLKPSLRLSNGYRVYSEKDLLRLQQIIVLKFFCFDLSQINTLLADKAETIAHFSLQAKLLEQNALTMLDAVKALQRITAELVDNKSIPWKTIIELIEGYRMTQKLAHSWMKEIFTPDELKKYPAFETTLKSRASPQQKAAFGKDLSDLIAEIKGNLDQDPALAMGVAMGKKCIDWLHGVYGKKYAHLRGKKFEKGFKEGKCLAAAGLTPEIVSWISKAMDAYWRERIYWILTQVGTGASDETIFKLWTEVLDEMCGQDDARKKEIYDMALADEKVSQKAKEWLKTFRNLAASHDCLP